MAWNNSDGLRVEFGTEKTKGAQVGAPLAGDGFRKSIVAVLEVGRMDTDGGLIGGRPSVFIPANSYIESATLWVTEAFVGASGTLDLGLANADGTYTNLDENGIDVAIAVGSLTVDTRIDCDGALIDTDIGSVDGYPSYDIDTTDFTAGKAMLEIVFIPPTYPDEGED